MKPSERRRVVLYNPRAVFYTMPLALIALASALRDSDVDVQIIDGAVNGMGAMARAAADLLRRMQTGYVRAYAAWILVGGILIVTWFLR